MPGTAPGNIEPKIRNLLSAPEMVESRTKIVELLIDVASGEEVRNVPIRTDDDVLFALAVVYAAGEKSFASRFFIFMRDYFEYNLRTLPPDEIEDNLNSLELGVSYLADSGIYTIPFQNYVSNTKKLSGSPYRLVFQSIDRGLVSLRKDVMIKIGREAYVKMLENLYSQIPETMVHEISGTLNEIPGTIAYLYRMRSKNNSFELGNVDPELFPPCVSEFIKEMKDGVNLPHMARFTLVSFLHHIGMKNEDIIALFATAPDYNERMTVYQVNHVSGESSGTEYSPPKCSVLASNHLCYKGEDTLCNQEWLKHPLQYYTVKKRPRKPREEKAKGASR